MALAAGDGEAVRQQSNSAAGMAGPMFGMSGSDSSGAVNTCRPVGDCSDNGTPIPGADEKAAASWTRACDDRGEFRVPPPDDTVPAPKPGGLPYRIIKRIFDVAFSLCVIAILFVPVALLCLVVVADSPGKPFFRQERVGRGGRPIRIWKLRTMVADAHEHPERYMTTEQLDTWRREQKLDDDPRVTRVGRVLRKTSLDELPQFLNVLTGDLSVIGPRPVTLEETYEFGNGRDEFLSCKPGITGWWQVTERNDATWENGDRQMLELFYVRHASFRLDLRIFVRTFKAMGRGK